MDEKGNVLRVTETAKKTYAPLEPYALIADGGDLTYTIWGLAPWQNIILYVIAALHSLSLAALIAFIVLALINRTSERKELRKAANNARKSRLTD